MNDKIDLEDLQRHPDRYTYMASERRWVRKGTAEWVQAHAHECNLAEAKRQADRFHKELIEVARREAAANGYNPDDPAVWDWYLRQPVDAYSEPFLVRDPDHDFADYVTRRALTRGELIHKMVERAQKLNLKALEAKRPVMSTGYQIKAVATVEFKAAPSGTGLLSGYLAVFGNVDAYGDIIKQGAFSASIKACRRHGRKYLLPLCYQHKMEQPIGGFSELTEDMHGLSFKAELDTDTSLGREVHSMVSKGYVSGMSIGYVTEAESFDTKGHRLLERIQLLEGSVVTMPANEEARIISVR